MAVQYDPGGEHGGQSERLISSGGNIYSLSSGQVKQGVHTRGRGFWVGKKRRDDDNPDVDDPSVEGAETLEESEELNEGLDDDVSPTEVWARTSYGKNAIRADLRQARAMMEAAAGKPMINKSVLTLRGVVVDLLLQNPEDLTEEQLVKSATTVGYMMGSASSDSERAVVANYAGRLARALRNTIAAREGVAKAILTKQSEAVNTSPDHPAKPPKKASETAVNDKGKVGYKYSKKNGGKGSDERAKSAVNAAKPDEGAEQAPDPEGGQVTSPPKVNPEPFCQMLGISSKQLKKFAGKKSRKEFVNYFMAQEALVEKRQVSPAYLGGLYDSLTQPEPQAPPPPPVGGPPASPQAPQGAPGPTPAMPGMKSLVVFNGATLNRRTLTLVDMLKSYKAETVEDIRRSLQTHYACTEDESMRATLSLLNRWERDGLVSFYPPKG